jgi:hypothetical protein
MRAKLAVLASVILSANASAEPIKYAVDGLALGMQLDFDDALYREYRCVPSDQFDSLTWCLKTRRDAGPRGSTATYSLLHSRDGSVFYINRAQEPRVSNPKKVQDEIEQYSHTFGESPQLIEMPHRKGLAHGLIAVWGKVTLEQMDHDSIKTLADRKDLKKGLLIDFLGNFARSAKASLPIYRIAGGPGLVWAGSFDQNGRGIVRLAAVDTSRFVAPSAAHQPIGQLPRTTSEPSEPPQRELSSTTEKVQTEPNPATAIAEPEKAKTAADADADQSEVTTDAGANLDVVPWPIATARAAPGVSSPLEAPQRELSLLNEKVQSWPDAATSIGNGEPAKAAPEGKQSEANTDKKADAGVASAPVEPTTAVPEVSSLSEAPQRELGLLTEKVQTGSNAATSIGNGEQAEAAPEEEQGANTDEKANAGVASALEATSAAPEVSSSRWEAIPYEATVGLLLAVLTACTLVICIGHKTRRSKEQALQPKNPTQAPARPSICPSLSPDAAVIEEIRRSSRRANESVLRVLASYRSGSAQLVSDAIERPER